MKRKKYLLLVCILIIFTSSCQKEYVQIEPEPDYKLIKNMPDDVVTKSNNKDSSLDNKEITDISKDTIKILDADNSDNDEYNHNDVQDTNITNTDTMNMSSSEQVGKEWPYTLDFNGVGEELIPTAKGNIYANFKGSLEESYIICPDEKRGCIYYINYEKDDYIYQWKDGVSTLLVGMKARCLQLWNNELYFVADKTDDDILMPAHGPIYCYNLDSSECRLVLDTNASKIFIDSDGIFYEDFNPEDSTSITKRLEFNADVPYKEKYFTCFSYDNYIIYDEFDDMFEGFYIHNKKTGEKTFLAPMEYFGKLCVYDNYLTFRKSTYIYILDLITGEKKIYDLNDYDGLTDRIEFITDYIIVDNILYATVNISGGIFTIDLKTEEITYIKSKNSAELYYILYAGDGKLYTYSFITNKLYEFDFLGNNEFSVRSIG